MAADHYKGLMPLDYLRRIENADFPLRVEDQNEINCVAVLEAAGLIEATITSPPKSPQTYEQREFAIVKRITPLGRAELLRKR